ncbi:MAG TPA: DUF2795 domain-containing protein [Gaiellaceae bacterium]|nr:DUF2795 domain-containing protein [Gaiellaceae bacterium]
MNTQRACEIQAVLEGVRLPATRKDLLAYAHAEDASIVPDLQGLPDEEFDRLDAVAELLTMRPSAPKPPTHGLPRPESGKPPGGPDYLTPFPSDTGAVRYTAPRDAPPQKALEQAAKTRGRQKKKQEE